jgi:hypothetical protein
LLSFPQFLSVGVFILHEVPQCTQAGFDFFWNGYFLWIFKLVLLFLKRKNKMSITTHEQ